MKKAVNHGIFKYTAFVPKTMNATKAVGRNVVKRINYFLKKSAKTVKRAATKIDKRSAKTIRSITKKRSRK